MRCRDPRRCAAPRVRRLKASPCACAWPCSPPPSSAATLLLFGLVVYVVLAGDAEPGGGRLLVDRARVMRDSVTVDPDARAAAFARSRRRGRHHRRGRRAGWCSPTARGQARTTSARTRLPVTPSDPERGPAGPGGAARRCEVEGADSAPLQRPLLVQRAPGRWASSRSPGPWRPTQAVLAVLRFVLLVSRAGQRRRQRLPGGSSPAAALRPIDQLTPGGGAIGLTQDFGRRVSPHISRRTDEVGRLAATFNAMLDRIQEAFGALQRRQRAAGGGPGVAAPLRGRRLARAAHAPHHGARATPPCCAASTA